MRKIVSIFLGSVILKCCTPFIMNPPFSTHQKVENVFRFRACIVPPCDETKIADQAEDGSLLRPSVSQQKDEPVIQILQSDTDIASLSRAASLMVDAYWLNSPTSLILPTKTDSMISSQHIPGHIREKLIRAQLRDFVERYDGDRSDRLLSSLLLKAVDPETDDPLGIVGIEVRICDKSTNVIHSLQKSEEIIRQATKHITEQERKRLLEHPNCVPRAVDKFLQPDMRAVCVLSNLAVSPRARRKGLGKKLCLEVEKVAQSYCGCDIVYLEVEENNFVARKLYEEKLGYNFICIGNAPAKRVDLTSGSFVDIVAPTIVMAKGISSTQQKCALSDTHRRQGFTAKPPFISFPEEQNMARP